MQRHNKWYSIGWKVFCRVCSPRAGQFSCICKLLKRESMSRHYSQVVTAVDSNLIDYQLLFEGAGSNPAGVVLSQVVLLERRWW